MLFLPAKVVVYLQPRSVKWVKGELSVNMCKPFLASMNHVWHVKQKNALIFSINNNPTIPQTGDVSRRLLLTTVDTVDMWWKYVRHIWRRNCETGRFLGDYMGRMTSLPWSSHWLVWWNMSKQLSPFAVPKVVEGRNSTMKRAKCKSSWAISQQGTTNKLWEW